MQTNLKTKKSKIHTRIKQTNTNPKKNKKTNQNKKTLIIQIKKTINKTGTKKQNNTKQKNTYTKLKQRRHITKQNA